MRDLAGLLVFLALIVFMFRAGYEWRKWETYSGTENGRDEPRDSLIHKI